MTQSVTIFHNPQCGTSRNTLALIQHLGIEPKVVEYLITPPSRAELVDMIKKANLTVRGAIRKNVEAYETLQLDRNDLSDEQLIDFMLEHPILINRPFVITAQGVQLCRPSEVVLNILPQQNYRYFVKEDGEVIIDQNGKRLK